MRDWLLLTVYRAIVGTQRAYWRWRNRNVRIMSAHDVNRVFWRVAAPQKLIP